MTRYWWVNHKQTAREEIRGGYLWSPKTKSNGANNYFYNTMREAAPGDYVISYADGEISYVGQVCEFALSRSKPDEFGTRGDAWNDEGWLLPVLWRSLSSLVRPKADFDKIRDLLPQLYSPLSLNTGNGNQACYLTEVSAMLFFTVLSIQQFDLDVLFGPHSFLTEVGVAASKAEEEVVQRIAADSALSATVKEQLIKSRKGQGDFRKNVQLFEKSCRLTGVATPHLLIASHIKPWRSCGTSDERLDGNNGLLLTPNADLLFDRGFLGFHDDGSLIVSPRLETGDLVGLGLHQVKTSQGAFRSGQLPYLDYHRRNVFLA